MSTEARRFTVAGPPVGKARPKHRSVTTKDGRTYNQEYTPSKTRTYEQIVRMEYERQCKMPPFPRESCIALDIIINRRIPSGTSKRKTIEMLESRIRPGKKPDVDNIVKSVSDSLNGVAFADDSQIVELRAQSYYANEPSVVVTLYAVGLNG